MTISRKQSLLIFRILFVLYLAAVAYLCFGHFENIKIGSPTLWGIPKDKIVHFCMFLPFPIMVRGSFDWKVRNVWKSLLAGLTGFVAGVCLGYLTEYGQSLTVYRGYDLMDLKADSIGLATGAALVVIFDIIRLIIKKNNTLC